MPTKSNTTQLLKLLDAIQHSTLKAALREYEATGDHDHGRGSIRPGGPCGEGDDCAVQPVKPQQCRDFPNLWNFPGFEKTCCAIPRLVSQEEYRRLVAQATGRPDHEIANVP